MGILRHIYIRMTGEQQLVNENKERSGDTRVIRQNRTHRKRESDNQVAPAPKQLGQPPATEKEDDDDLRGSSSRVNNSSRKEELSAQRRKKKKFSVFGISDPSPMELESRIYVSQPWTATASRWIRWQGPGTGTFFNDYWVQDYQQQRTNSYTIIPSQTWAPKFTQDSINNRTFTNAPVYELGATTVQFDWTFYQSNRPDGNPGNSLIVATLPQLPDPPTTWFQNHPRVSINHLPAIAASDGRYIWYSTVYALSRPSVSFFTSFNFTNWQPGYDSLYPLNSQGNENRNWDFDNGGVLVDEQVSRRTLNNEYPYFSAEDPKPLQYNINIPNDNNQRFSGWWFGEKPFNTSFGHLYSDVNAYSLTWRYDTQNPQSPPNFSLHSLGYRGDGTATGLHNFASMYLGALDASHPAKEQWIQMLASKTANESFAYLANRYFDSTYGSGFYSLVPGLVYYKDTGLAIYTGKLKRAGSFPTFPRVYTKTLTPNLSYSSASYRMPYPSSTPGSYFKEFLTTHEDMIANAWEEQATAPVAQVGTANPYYFTHRTT